jgi:hypothetical protein
MKNRVSRLVRVYAMDLESDDAANILIGEHLASTP